MNGDRAVQKGGRARPHAPWLVRMPGAAPRLPGRPHHTRRLDLDAISGPNRHPAEHRGPFTPIHPRTSTRTKRSPPHHAPPRILARAQGRPVGAFRLRRKRAAAHTASTHDPCHARPCQSTERIGLPSPMAAPLGGGRGRPSDNASMPTMFLARKHALNLVVMMLGGRRPSDHGNVCHRYPP